MDTHLNLEVKLKVYKSFKHKQRIFSLRCILHFVLEIFYITKLLFFNPFFNFFSFDIQQLWYSLR